MVCHILANNALKVPFLQSVNKNLWLFGIFARLNKPSNNMASRYAYLWSIKLDSDWFLSVGLRLGEEITLSDFHSGGLERVFASFFLRKDSFRGGGDNGVWR